MKHWELERSSIDDLWALHTEIATILEDKLQQEKKRLTERLERLQTSGRLERLQTSGRRPYPPVNPKYCNPEQPSETWSGRGRQPRWLVKQLKHGRQVEEFRIQAA